MEKFVYLKHLFDVFEKNEISQNNVKLILNALNLDLEIKADLIRDKYKFEDVISIIESNYDETDLTDENEEIPTKTLKQYLLLKMNEESVEYLIDNKKESQNIKKICDKIKKS